MLPYFQFITTFVFSQQNSFEQKFQTKTYMGDNVSYCKECKKETGPTRVSFDLRFKTQTDCISHSTLNNTEIEIYGV